MDHGSWLDPPTDDVVIPFAEAVALLKQKKPHSRRGMHAGGWADESAAVVREMWPDPKNTATVIASEIMARFGWLPTRNSVVGKAHRLFGPEFKKPPRPSVWVRKKYPRKSKPKVIGTIKVIRIVNSRPALIDLMIREEDRALADFNDAIPEKQRKQLWDLGPNDCRYPVGTPGAPNFYFCGGAIDEGCSYCIRHRQFCTAGIPERKPAARRAA